MKILIIVILLFSHLIGINGESKISHSQTCEDSIKVFLEDWKRDSTGCLHLRNIENTSMLIEKLELKKRSANDIIKLLGRPNINTIFETDLIFEYNILSVCLNNVPIDSSDKIKVRFIINIKDSIVKDIQCRSL